MIKRWQENKKLHLVSHTHWDREWYLPFEVFRFRLVGLMDRLLNTMEEHSEYRFHLDGQAIILEDYLEIRPENQDRIRRLVQKGQLTIGPWYVLADEFLVSGEAIIRNLEEGKRICLNYGEPMAIGYLPDTFGHIGQMPQILSGFGLPSAILWRGLNGTPEEVPAEFLWEAPSGDRVVAFHLPFLYGYTSAMNLSLDPEEAAEKIRSLAQTLGSFSLTGHVLLMNGFDHWEPQKDIGGIVEYWNDNENVILEHSSLPQYVRESMESGKHTSLPVLHGEFRQTNHSEGGSINAILPGVLSSRVYLKQQNAAIQTLLEKWTEPVLAVTGVQLGKAYHEFTRLAWKYVLQNHPHDSICGCSVDAVHDEMETRFAKATQIAEQLVVESLHQLGEGADSSWVGKSEAPFLLFNPLPWKRNALVELELDTDETRLYRSARIRAESGEEWIGEIVSVDRICPIQSYTGEYPLSKTEVNRYRIRFHVESMPSLGYKVVGVELRTHPPLLFLPLSASENWIANKYVKLIVENDGSLTWIDRQTGQTWKGLHRWEDAGDVGDGYSYSPPLADEKVVSPSNVQVSLVSEGYGWSEMKITYTMTVPRRIDSSWRKRDAQRIDLEFVTRVKLLPGSRTASFHTTIRNTASDHRLRVLFPVEGKTGMVHAGAQFDIKLRPDNIEQPSPAVWFENEPTTFPFHDYLYIDTDKARISLTSKGLYEYEWIAGDSPVEGLIALTLFRSVGFLAGADRGMNTSMRPGPGVETPGGQCQRLMEFEYSLTFDPACGELPWRIADEERVLVRACLIGSGRGTGGEANKTVRMPSGLPSEYGWLNLDSTSIQITSIRPPINGMNGVEVRLVNYGERVETARLLFGWTVKRILLMTLDGKIVSETPIECANDRSEYKLELGAKKIATLILEAD